MKQSDQESQFQVFINDIKDYWTDYLIHEYLPPAPEDRRKRRRRLAYVVILIIAVAFFLLWGLDWVKYYNSLPKSNLDSSHWLSFIASFWGGICGAIIAGAVTIITTEMIINRSYKVDYHRERIEHLPVLDMKYVNDNNSEILLLKNVGYGLALRLYTENENRHDQQSISILATGETATINFRIMHSLKMWDNSDFSIIFFDLFDNQYRQTFTIETFDDGTMSIQCNAPQLIKRTGRVRYMQ